MITPTRILLGVVALAVAAGCAPSGEPTQADIDAAVAAVTALRDQEVAAINAGEADISYLAADAVMMPPNEPAVSGSAAIAEWVDGFLSQFKGRLEYSSSEIMVSGDWAIETYAGTLSMTPVAGGAMMEESVKGIHIYRRGEDGTWKMVYDVWNSSNPMAEPEM